MIRVAGRMVSDRNCIALGHGPDSFLNNSFGSHSEPVLLLSGLISIKDNSGMISKSKPPRESKSNFKF